MSQKLNESKSKCCILQDWVTSLEVYTRRNNLKFPEIRQPQKESTTNIGKNSQELLVTLCHKVGVTINPDEIECAHPIGHFRERTDQS